jgi:hypothetical protein
MTYCSIILKSFTLPKKAKEAIHERVNKIDYKKSKQDEKNKNEKPNDSTQIKQK